MTFGQFLLQTMSKNGLTQEQVASRIKKLLPKARISQALISRWTRGLGPPKRSDARILALAKVLGKDPKELTELLGDCRPRALSFDKSVKVTKKNIEFLLTVFNSLESKNKNQNVPVTLGLEDILHLLAIKPNGTP